MEGRKLHVAGVLGPHLVKHFLKGVESAVRRVHIVLVYLHGDSTVAVSPPGRPNKHRSWLRVAKGPHPRGVHRYSVNLSSGAGHKVQP